MKQFTTSVKGVYRLLYDSGRVKYLLRPTKDGKRRKALLYDDFKVAVHVLKYFHLAEPAKAQDTPAIRKMEQEINKLQAKINGLRLNLKVAREKNVIYTPGKGGIPPLENDDIC